MANRITHKRDFHYDKRILKTGKVAYNGAIACLNTADGKYWPAEDGVTTLVPKGYFRDSFTGDDVELIEVELFAPIRGQGFDNDTGGGEVLEAHVGSTVYLKDDHTVSITSTSRSRGGRVIELEGTLVWVEMQSGIQGLPGSTTDDSETIAAQTKTVPIPLTAFRIASSGAALPAYVADSADGIDPTTGAIRFNNGATPPALMAVVQLPTDLDYEEDVEVHALVSKSGATLADAVTLTFGAKLITDGLLHDADSDMGGATNALVGNATAKTVTEVLRTLTAANINDVAPQALQLTMKPTNGTLGTDDCYVHSVWLEYLPRALV